MKRYYALLLFTILLGNCKKESSITINQKLVGQWKFVSTKGGFTGNQVILPAAGTTTILVLNSNKTYQMKVNGLIQEDGSYDVSQIQSIYTGKNDNGIKFDNLSDWKLVSVQNDTLSIADNHVEPFATAYNKVN